MEKIELPFFYKLGATLNPVININTATVTWGQMYLWVQRTKPYFDELFRDYPLTVCKKAGTELIEQMDYWDDVNTATAKAQLTQLDTTDQGRALVLADKAREFEAVLSAELQTLATYQVAKKGAYSTPELVERADNVFPPAIKERLPEDAVKDVRESGRCLAFDNPTASAFHIMRATETVMHAYYSKVCKPKSEERLNNWGAYIEALKDSGDTDAQEIVAIMQQIKDNHRNLIMHPEVFLDGDEAFTLFEIAQGAIIAMAGKL